MRSITAMAEVDIDLDDYFDEFLEDASDEELTKELEKRGFRVIGKSSHTVPMGELIQFIGAADLKRHLCDISDLGYYVSDDDLLDAIKQKLQ